jgi:hypothetical protein
MMSGGSVDKRMGIGGRDRSLGGEESVGKRPFRVFMGLAWRFSVCAKED